MHSIVKSLSYNLYKSLRDIAPIVMVVVVFQLLVIQQPMPNVASLISGLAMVVVGLTLFIYGLNLALFPLGDSLAHAFAKKGSLFWLLTFAMALGFGTTIAEPALIAVANEAANIAAQGQLIAATPESILAYSASLRYTVAFAVGVALVIGVLRIIKGWPLPWLIMGCYLLVVLITAVAPAEIIGIAYDSGGVTTSTITVPLVTALGIGLASSIKGRNPMLDGFGLIALASLLPILFVLIFGMVML